MQSELDAVDALLARSNRARIRQLMQAAARNRGRNPAVHQSRPARDRGVSPGGAFWDRERIARSLEHRREDPAD